MASAIAFVIAMPSAAACGFHGPIEGNWTPLHPKSIDVAVAVRQAADAGLLDASLLDARAAGPMGVLRATKQLRALGLYFSGSAGSSSAPPPMTLLFVESSLWTRYAPTQGGMTPQVHVQGPERGDVVIVTSEAVIAAVLARRLSARQAIARGLIAFDGPADAIRTATTSFEGMAPSPERTPVQSRR